MTNINKKLPDTCIIIHPILKLFHDEFTVNKLEEARGLAKSIDLKIYQADIVILSKIAPATYIGEGKIEEYRGIIEHEKIKLVIIDTQLTPVQQRNLEKAWNCKVIDRNALIIEIFADRARSSEGKLQVDLAALEYQKSRLVRSWTHLERQRGGFGFTGGPGETQIESDRRVIRNQIDRIKEALVSVKKMRKLHRKFRNNMSMPTIALVGYTNAGKTSLFNMLANETQYAADKLFATLDPTMRQINLPSRRRIIMTDTVGFISDLPTELIAAFSATLEEVTEADLIIHVIDASHPEHVKQKQDVEKVLKMLGIKQDAENILIVRNKMDLLDESLVQDDNLYISVKENKNIDKLLDAIDHYFAQDEIIETYKIDNHNGKIISWLYDNSVMIEQNSDEDHTYFKILISEENKSKLEKLLDIKSES